MKLMLKNMFKLTFPFLFCKSLEDFTSIVLIFPKFNFKNFLTLVCIYLHDMIFMADGLLYSWIDTRFLIIPMTTLGPFVASVHFIFGTAFAEIILFRSYCLYRMLRSGKACPTWYAISSKIKQNEHPKLFKVAQFLFSQLVLSAMLVHILNHVAKLLEFSTPLDYVVNIAWIFIQISLLRFTPVVIPYLYTVAYFCYLYVRKQTDLLLNHFAEPFLGIHRNI